jgi:hypothetical protein
VLADLRAFAPVNGNWRRLDDLLAELGDPAPHVGELLRVLERFPGEDGAGVLWSVIHLVETVAEYESELIASLRRVPSFLGIVMVGRLLNVGKTTVAGTLLTALLSEVSANASAHPLARNGDELSSAVSRVRFTVIEGRAESVAREPDEAVAKLVFAYIAGVIGTLTAALAWVFWFRGYA